MHYELVLYSIFRDSENYLDRYLSQIESLLPHFNNIRLVWLTGDNDDNTGKILENWQNQHQRLAVVAAATGVNNLYVDILQFDTGGPYWPSVSNSLRWHQLKSCWNECIKAKYETDVVVCVESDLIWEVQDLLDVVSMVRNGECDVAYPALYKYESLIWYDTNGFSYNGQKFTNEPPHIPGGFDGNHVPVDTGGGMIVSSEIAFMDAMWEDTCVLHFPEWTTRLLTREVVIYHP